MDLTTNHGGAEEVLYYLYTIMTNKNRDKNSFDRITESSITGNRLSTRFTLDLDLNGTIDEADKNVYYDFNYAVLTSQGSYSCGNYLPCLAQDSGILVLGETSGGGSCVLSKNYFADELFFTMSSSQKLIRDGEKDVDEGAKVVYDLTKKKADGSVDYSGMFNFAQIDKDIDEFYGVKAEDSSQQDSSSQQESSSQQDSSSKQGSSVQPSGDGEDTPPPTGYAGTTAVAAVVLIAAAALAVIKKRED